MKKIIFPIVIVSSLILFGCSSTHTLSDFSSQKNFYDDFNYFAKGKDLKIIPNDDNTYYALGGAKITGDTLVFVSQTKKEEVKIQSDKIKNIKYFGSDFSNLSANIILKNGEELQANHVSLLSDSSINAILTKNIYTRLPMGNVYEVTYKNHWLGVPARLLTGTAIGAVLGLIGVAVFVNQNNQNQGDFYTFTGLTVIGFVAGTIWGWIEGYNFIYKFSQ